MAEMTLIFLGTGTSHGVPMIACDCPVCTSDDPRDRRNRAAVAVRFEDGRAILIDAPPDLRLASIACGLRRVDAVLFTHTHADHIMGLDDLRRFNDVIGATIPCYASAASVARLRTVFDYAEGPRRAVGGDRPSVKFEVIDRPTRVCGVEVVPIPLLHGGQPVLGFRIGPMAYCTDCSAIPETSRPLLAGLELLVLDALRHTPHPTHFNLAQATAEAAIIGARRTVFTHLAHEISHAETGGALGRGVELGYDGLSVTLYI